MEGMCRSVGRCRNYFQFYFLRKTLMEDLQRTIPVNPRGIPEKKIINLVKHHGFTSSWGGETKTFTLHFHVFIVREYHPEHIKCVFPRIFVWGSCLMVAHSRPYCLILLLLPPSSCPVFHTLTTHTQLTHTQLSHTQLTHTQLSHTQLTHTQLTNTHTHTRTAHSHTTYSHSHNLLTHTQLTHTQLSHTHNSPAHNSLTHTHTTTHTQLTHTQPTHTHTPH